MPAKTDPYEVIAHRTLVEQRWAYERRVERLTWQQISDLAPRPVAEGGLGYPRSAKSLRAAHAAYLSDAIADEQRTREEHVHAALLDLDTVSRNAADLAGLVDTARTKRDRVFLRIELQAMRRTDDDGNDVGPLYTDREIEQRVAAHVVFRSDADRLRALGTHLSTHDRRAKLLGLDAPDRLEVTHHDGTIDAMNAALARLDPDSAPIKEKTP